MTPIVHEQCEAYLALLQKWNKRHNLTAITDIKQMRIKHIADSLSVAPFIEGERILDVGTGPGLPGIPLAILMPDKHFVLIDCIAKKTQFIRHAIQVLDLNNVEVVQTRVEAYQPPACFDMICSRAFSQIDSMISATKHLLCKHGKFLAMKGKYPEEELKNISPSRYRVHALAIQGLDAERHLVVISQ